MDTSVTLKELLDQYTITQILCEANEKYTLYAEDTVSLIELIKRIRESPNNDGCGKDIVLMVSYYKTNNGTTFFSFGGFQKNGRNYRFTGKNCSNIDKIACSKVQTVKTDKSADDPYISEYLPSTDLELLIIILLSINAFSPEVVDCYFDGDINNASSAEYILQLIENNDSPINNI